MAWVFLLLAGGLEICWPLALKQADGFTRLWPSVVAIVLSVGSFGLLSLALKNLQVGPSYAVWTGIGIAGTTTVGMLYFNDTVSPVRLGCIALILIGIVGLNLTSTQ
jgi:quaternary ammonium compound-resistance protein SugE